jgi:hypothetical protein
MELKKNSIYTIEITDMGNEGEGIGHLSLSDVAITKQAQTFPRKLHPKMEITCRISLYLSKIQ